MEQNLFMVVLLYGQEVLTHLQYKMGQEFLDI